MGRLPMGLVVFQADGRMMAVLCDGRTELPPGEPRQFMSYAGNYTFDGDDAFDSRRCLVRCKPGRRRPGAQGALRERPHGACAAAAALRRRHAASGAVLGARCLARRSTASL